MPIYPSLVVCLFVVVVSGGSTIDDNAPAIARHPYVASVELDNRYVGGASILNRYFVLTYATIIQATAELPWQIEGGLLSVRTGSDYAKRNGRVHTVRDYRWNNESLVAVLQLADPIEFDELRQPIRLFDSTDAVVPGATVVLSAMAKDEDARVNAPKLRIHRGVVRANCSTVVYEDGTFCIDTPDGMRWTDGRGHPAVVDGVQAGIVALSYKGETYVSDLSASFDWITRTVSLMMRDKWQNARGKCH